MNIYSAYPPGFNPGIVPKSHMETAVASANNTQAVDPFPNPAPLKPAAQGAEKGRPPDEKNSQEKNHNRTETGSNTGTADSQALTAEETRLLKELKQIDASVRQHEMAHVAAGGPYITSGAVFSYQRGPDGNNYAVAGEVSIDTSPVPGDPQATLRKMRQIKNSALAPSDPSPQDLKVASKATSAAAKALSELMVLQTKERLDADESPHSKGVEEAADSYETVRALPEENTTSFQVIA